MELNRWKWSSIVGQGNPDGPCPQQPMPSTLVLPFLYPIILLCSHRANNFSSLNEEEVLSVLPLADDVLAVLVRHLRVGGVRV